MTLRLGLRAHDFGTLPAHDLAASIATSGATCVQLALSKALPGEPMLPESLGDEGVRAVAHAFNHAEIDIAVLGCYIDMVTPNLAEREQALRRFEAHLASASAFNCSIVGTETGSPVPYGENLEAAFHVAKDGLLRLIRAAEKVSQTGHKVLVGIEPVAETHALSSCDHVRQLIKEANSPALGVIFDPTNLIPQKGVSNLDSFLDECFDAFGEHIVALHVKDFRMLTTEQGRVKSGPIPAGEGEMNWHAVFDRLKQYNKQHIPILLEDTGPDKAESTFSYLKNVAKTSL